jgi:hypothetical protein
LSCVTSAVIVHLFLHVLLGDACGFEVVFAILCSKRINCFAAVPPHWTRLIVQYGKSFANCLTFGQQGDALVGAKLGDHLCVMGLISAVLYSLFELHLEKRKKEKMDAAGVAF